jgi:transcriptional regulator with XRE-family HTH domain
MTMTTDQQVEKERKDRGRKLRRIRRSRGLPVATLAGQAECSASHLDNIERGTKRPSVELLYRICRELAVPLEELATAEDHERIDA